MYFLQNTKHTWKTHPEPHTRDLHSDDGYPCSVCGKLFAQKIGLTRHMSQHTGQYKYYCEPCKKGFAQKYRYEDHMKLHAGMRFYCNYCGKNFTSSDQLKKHMKMNHPEH